MFVVTETGTDGVRVRPVQPIDHIYLIFLSAFSTELSGKPTIGHSAFTSHLGAAACQKKGQKEMLRVCVYVL